MWPFGATSAAHTLAQNAQRHFHRYGTTRETLGWIALNQRANAILNPTAIYRDPLTMREYLEARLITTPFGLYDCDVPCDGAVAGDRLGRGCGAGPGPAPGAGGGGGHPDHRAARVGPEHADARAAGPRQAAHLWTRTSLGPGDVDVAELYDGFTFNCLSWIEALGFCGIGEAKDSSTAGRTSPGTARCR